MRTPEEGDIIIDASIYKKGKRVPVKSYIFNENYGTIATYSLNSLETHQQERVRQ